jgi:hypothetical protein
MIIHLTMPGGIASGEKGLQGNKRSRNMVPGGVRFRFLVGNGASISPILRRRSPYSYRSATVGFTDTARRVGIKHAATATTASNNEIAANVDGSVALTSYSAEAR